MKYIPIIVMFLMGCEAAIEQNNNVTPSQNDNGGAAENEPITDKQYFPGTNCDISKLRSNGINYHDYGRTEYQCRYREAKDTYEYEYFELALFRDYSGYINTKDTNFEFTRFKYNESQCMFTVVDSGARAVFDMSHVVVNEGKLMSFIMLPYRKSVAHNVKCDLVFGPIN